MKKRIYFLVIFFTGFSALGAACSSSSNVSEPIPAEEVVEEDIVESSDNEPDFLPGEIKESNEDELVKQPLIGEVNFGDEEVVVDENNVVIDDETPRLFNMIVKKFEFVPNIIKVKKDNKVIINITSEDVEHSFVIKDYKLHKTIPEGESIKIEFVADQIGEFDFYSDIYAGVGTDNMRGTLIVIP